jgi:prevent-host-death family protein
MHESNQRGAVAEAAIALAAIRAGVGVFKPASDGERYDLIFDLRPRLVRVQCKAASIVGDVVIVRCRSGRRTRDGILMRPYTRDEIDAFAAYCAALDRCFFMPIGPFDGQTVVSLRLGAPRNNQRAGVNWADDFAFEATLRRSGAVAQLGERLAGSQKVRGSNPLGSTPGTDASVTVGAHEFRNHFGWYMERAAGGEEIAVTRRGKPAVRLCAATKPQRPNEKTRFHEPPGQRASSR